MFASEMQHGRQWRTQLAGKVNGGLAIAGDILYVDDFSHSVYALNALNGHKVWRTTLDDVAMSTPVLSHGVLVIGTGTSVWLPWVGINLWGRPRGNSVYGLDARDGRILWRFRTVGEDMPSPAIVKDSVVFANGDHHAYALNLRTGRLIWKAPILGVATMASAEVDGRLAFFGSCIMAPYRCELRAMDAETGKTRWISQLGSSDPAPTIHDGIVFTERLVLDRRRFADGGTTVAVALNERTGKPIWTLSGKPGPCSRVGSALGQVSATFADGVLFQPMGCQHTVLAINPHDGKAIWTFEALGAVKMSPVVSGGEVYFGDTEGILYALDERSGHLRRAIPFAKPFTTSPPLIVGSTFFIANGSILYALRMPLERLSQPDGMPLGRAL